MFERIKKLFRKEKPAPPPPKSVDGFTDWLYKHHPAYKEPSQPDETGGPRGPEPTRYGTWERGGREIDF